ncbi:hypothetical protein ACEWY4_015706 [Coilia grayii]|uniref:G-protein coupled receptors family 1 profile domain-containing protein n=1 Tax=Coilia grayii TaxID=363190 RepID=A0ABD1JNV9_9TELE
MKGNMQNVNNSSSNITSMSTENQVSAWLLSFCFLLGFPGNIVVVVIIIRYFKKDNFTLHLMLSLAVSDILCLISLPLWIYSLNFEWIFSRGLCKFLFILIFTSMYSSVLTVTLMSVYRYLVVLHRSQWAKLGRKGERVLLCCLWTLALILSSPVMAKANVVVKGQGHHCWRISGLDQESLAILLCEILLGFVLPFSIMASFYFCLHKKVNQTTFFSNPRLARLVTTIILTFVILWFPVHVINLVKVLAIAFKSTNPSVSEKLIGFWNVSSNIVNSLTFLNSCVNPLLYVCTFRLLFQKSEKQDRAGTSTLDSRL